MRHPSGYQRMSALLLSGCLLMSCGYNPASKSELAVQSIRSVAVRDGVTTINVPLALLDGGLNVLIEGNTILKSQAVTTTNDGDKIMLEFSNGEKVAYQNMSGYAVTSDDVILAPSDKIASYAAEYQTWRNKNPDVYNPPPATERAVQSQSHIGKRGTICFFRFIRCWVGYNNTPNWPSSIINYTITGASPNEVIIIENAVADWNKETGNKPKWQPGTGGTTIKVVNSIPFSTCGIAPIGFTQQQLVPFMLLSREVIPNSEPCLSKRSIQHEMGHVVGLNHEHQRCDRDNYINVNYSWWEFVNYNKLCRMGEDLGPYDFDSIMHYNNSKMSPKNPLPGNWVGSPHDGRLGGSILSPNDKAWGLKTLYP